MTKPKTEVAPSVRKSTRILIAATFIGFALGVYFASSMGPDAGSFDLFSNSQISSLVASVGIVVWLIIVPPLTLLWWRTVDEHEKDAYRDGANISAHIYLFFVPAWWLAARAGWVPAQDPMIVLVVISFIWTAVWLYRKYF